MKSGNRSNHPNTHSYVQVGSKRLTSQQLRLLQLISWGDSRKAIVDKLGIANKSYDGLRQRLFVEVGVNDNVSLAHFALHAGVVPNRFSGVGGLPT